VLETVIGPLVTGEDNKDHVLFLRRIGAALRHLSHRPSVLWIAHYGTARRPGLAD
jgi:hypothetical protein